VLLPGSCGRVCVLISRSTGCRACHAPFVLVAGWLARL